MRVLFYTWEVNGGTTSVVKSLQEGLDLRGIGSDIAYHNFERQVRYEEQKKGKNEFFPTLESLAEWLSKTKKYELVHSHACTASDYTITYMIGKFDSPLIYTAHGILAHEIVKHPKNAEYAEWLSRQPLDRQRDVVREDLRDRISTQTAMFRHAKKIIHLSNYFDNIFRFYYPEYADKSVVIPNGSDFHKFANDEEVNRKALEIRNSFSGGRKSIILCSGRLREEKGVYDLARAFNKIREGNDNASLLFVGEGDTDGIIANVKEKNRSDVAFMNWTHDRKTLAAIYKAADVTVIPTYHENFCLTALESMMVGTPVVISDVDGPHELYVEPMLAYGCTPGDANSIADRVDWVLRNPKDAKRNASMVQRIATGRFGLDKWVNSTLKSYEDILYS